MDCWQCKKSGFDWKEERVYADLDCCGTTFCLECTPDIKLQPCPVEDCGSQECSRFHQKCGTYLNVGIINTYIWRCSACNEVELLCDSCSRGELGRRHCEMEKGNKTVVGRLVGPS